MASPAVWLMSKHSVLPVAHWGHRRPTGSADRPPRQPRVPQYCQGSQIRSAYGRAAIFQHHLQAQRLHQGSCSGLLRALFAQ